MKKNKIIFWIATAIIFIWEGLMPLSTVLWAPQYVNAGTKPLGYPDYFAYALIFCKILGVLAIAFHKTPHLLKEWAYAGLTFNLVFAFISHAVVDKNLGFMIMPVAFLAILVVSYIYYHKIKQQTTTSRLSKEKMPFNRAMAV